MYEAIIIIWAYAVVSSPLVVLGFYILDKLQGYRD